MLHRIGEGVVAAGVQDHDLDPLGAVHRAEDQVQRHGLEVHVAVGCQGGVDGDQIVVPAHLHAVASVIDHGDIGAARVAGEGFQDLLELDLGQVLTSGHREADLAQGLGHGRGVIGRIGQAPAMGIGRIADDQGDPRLGQRPVSGHQQRGEARQKHGHVARQSHDHPPLSGHTTRPS